MLFNSRNPLQDLTNVYTVKTLMAKQASCFSECRHAHREHFSKIYSACIDCGSFLVSSMGAIRDTESFKLTTSVRASFANMQKLEHQMRKYSAKVASMKERPTIIDWLCGIGESLKQSCLTIHKAVAYFDYVLASFETKPNGTKMKLYALSCLMVASKYYELDRNIPRIKALIEKTNYEFSDTEVKSAENLILRILNWNLECVTPMDYIDFFLAQGVIYFDDKLTQNNVVVKQINRKIAESLRKYCEFFADLCLQNYSFLEFNSLSVASAIIASSRKALHFQKIWCDHLNMLTSLEFRQIKQCFESIYSVYYQMFPNARANIEGPKQIAKPVVGYITHRDSSVPKITDENKSNSSRMFNRTNNGNTSFKDGKNASGIMYKNPLKIKIDNPFPVKTTIPSTSYKTYVDTTRYDRIRNSKSINPLTGRKPILRL